MDSALGKDRLVIVFGGQGILLDVEGTTSSIAFVYDVLFVHAKRHVGDFLAARCGDPDVRAAAMASNALGFIQDLPDGFDTRVGSVALPEMKREKKEQQ